MKKVEYYYTEEAIMDAGDFQEGLWNLERALRIPLVVVFEETGLTVGKLILLGLHSGKNTFYEYPNGHQVYDATAVFATSDFTGGIQADGGESLDVNFFDLCELPQNISPPDKTIFTKFIQHIDE